MSSNRIDRRKFIKRSAATALGTGVVSNIAISQSAMDKKAIVPEIKEYRKFGRTGFNVSDISSGSPSNEAVLKTLIKSGVNLIDTGEVYGNGNSERLIGGVLNEFERSKLFINTKLYTEKSFPSKENVIERTNKCLERLQTDYIDCMQIHSAENSAILKDEAFHAGMEQMKREGKVRHIGVSCHGNNWAIDTEEDMGKILLSAIEDGRFDVILLAYNFVNAEIAGKVLEACDKKDIATIIMKSNPVQIYGMMEDKIVKLKEEGKEPDKHTRSFYDRYKIMNEKAFGFFKKYGIAEENLQEAASKFVLSNPNAHTTLWDFKNFAEVNRMLNLSGSKLTKQDDLVLNRYNSCYGKLNCKMGCNRCESVCPHNLPISKVMRYNYYFAVKNQEKRAMIKYARLMDKKYTDLCSDCEGFCEKECPYGIETRTLLAAAQHNLELMV